MESYGTPLMWWKLNKIEKGNSEVASLFQIPADIRIMRDIRILHCRENINWHCFLNKLWTYSAI